MQTVRCEIRGTLPTLGLMVATPAVCWIYLLNVVVQEKVDLLTMRLEQGGGSMDKADNADQLDGAMTKSTKKCRLKDDTKSV